MTYFSEISLTVLYFDARSKEPGHLSPHSLWRWVSAEQSYVFAPTPTFLSRNKEKAEFLEWKKQMCSVNWEVYTSRLKTIMSLFFLLDSFEISPNVRSSPKILHLHFSVQSTPKTSPTHFLVHSYAAAIVVFIYNRLKC